MGSLLTGSARPARTRAPGASVACVYDITRMKSTGAAQVMQPGKSVRARLPVSDPIIVPLDSMSISPQCEMVGSVHHLQRWVGWMGVLTAVTSQVSERELSFSLCFTRVTLLHGFVPVIKRWNHLTLICASKNVLDYVIEVKTVDMTDSRYPKETKDKSVHNLHNHWRFKKYVFTRYCAISFQKYTSCCWCGYFCSRGPVSPVPRHMGAGYGYTATYRWGVVITGMNPGELCCWTVGNVREKGQRHQSASRRPLKVEKAPNNYRFCFLKMHTAAAEAGLRGLKFYF